PNNTVSHLSNFFSFCYSYTYPSYFLLLFFFNAPSPTEIYTLSLHDALPIFQSLIATPRDRRTYPENKINRWRITRQCAVPQAKPAVSRDICAEPWAGSGCATPR